MHDQDAAWHSGNHEINHRSIGIEHEGFSHTGSTWYTESMYRSSSALARWLSDTFQIPRDRTHIIGHYEVPDTNHPGWFGGASNHHDPCDSWNGSPTWHNNIACYWNWSHYMDLVNGTVATGGTGMLTGFVGDACCGTTAGARHPLVGATVTLTGTAQSAKTDATGTYAFTLPPGTYTPRATNPGYDPGDHTSLGPGYAAGAAVTAGTTTSASILLHPTQVVVAAPVVKITAPADGAVVSTSPLPVRGTVSDASVKTVKIAGQDFAAANGSFSATAVLTAGVNAVTAIASNAGGTGSATIHVSYAPPQTGVQGKVSGPSGGAVALAGISLTPGSLKAVSADDGHYLIAAPPGAYTLSVDAPGFKPVTQAITVPGDKFATADLALEAATVPAAPHLRIDAPSEGQAVETATVLVSGVVVAPDLASLSVNGEQVVVATNLAFSAEVALKPGANEIVVLATETSGHTMEARVHVQQAAPVSLSKTGCGSAGPGDLLALLSLGFFLARPRR